MPIHFQNKTNVMNGLNKKECLIYIMKKWDGGRARKTSEMYNFCWENNTPGDCIMAVKSRLVTK